MREDLIFWKQAVIKGIVTAGFTLFSVVSTIGWQNCWEIAGIAGGTYIFAEAIKYYNLQPNKTIKEGTYKFLV